ncbi:hypothetical protein QYM36_000380 [Artemia franciscana]|uniref:Hexosyltransferase n=2 Tax=Artemia franciscana TaxID=6661 RepID=A0AA88IQH2_ARTSF|nr:hypothetical protein QYM36_000380 [Artemia franciscana]
MYVVAIHSASDNIRARLAIRNTWGNLSDLHVPVIFFIGLSISKTVNDDLIDEFKAYQDLVLGNFIDTYRNLTWKHLMLLNWTKKFCPTAKYVLKFDDDILADVRAMTSYLDRLDNNTSIICSIVSKAMVQRGARSKWCVPKQEYCNGTYPLYCNGFAVAYPMQSIPSLLNLSKEADYFWIDDVFVTGILAEKAKIQRVSADIFVLPSDFILKIIVKHQSEGKARTIFKDKYIVPLENQRDRDLAQLWHRLRKAF